MKAESSANITRSQRTGTLVAIFCPSEEKKITPINIGMSIIHKR